MRTPMPGRAASLASLSLAMALLVGCSSPSGADDPTSSETPGTRSVEHARNDAGAGGAEACDRARTGGTRHRGRARSDTVGVMASNVSGVPEYLGVDGVEPVGTVPEPDLEAIAALEPDLILGTESRHSQLYAQLDAIAPTVFMQTQADPWQENVLLIGEALGQKDGAQTLLDGFNERCEEIADEFDVAGTTANLIRPRDETTLSVPVRRPSPAARGVRRTDDS